MHHMVDHLLAIEVRYADGAMNLLAQTDKHLRLVNIQMKHRQQVVGITVLHVHQVRVKLQHLVVVVFLYHQVDGLQVAGIGIVTDGIVGWHQHKVVLFQSNNIAFQRITHSPFLNQHERIEIHTYLTFLNFLQNRRNKPGHQHARAGGIVLLHHAGNFC